MSTDSYPILVNPNPTPLSPKRILPGKIFILFLLILVGLGGSLYFLKNKFGRIIATPEDPTTKQQALQTHADIWSASLELDTTSNRAKLTSDPDISASDLFAPVITQKPETKEGEWAFEVVVENKKGEIIYRSYRTMSIFPQEENPKKWDFGVVVPYIKEGIIRIFDLNNNQLFAGDL